MSEQRKGFLLRSHIVGESDLWVDFLYQSGAILKLKARGAKRSKKRFPGGVLEPLQYISIHFEEKGSARYLLEAKIIDPFEGIRSDYDLVFWGSKLLQLTSFYAQEDLEEPLLFHLVGNTLKYLNQSGKNAEYAFWHFLARLMSLQGDLALEESYAPLVSHPVGAYDEASYKSFSWNMIKSRLASVFRGHFHRELQEFLS